jgi:hypothetical protein
MAAAAFGPDGKKGATLERAPPDKSITYHATGLGAEYFANQTRIMGVDV